MKEVPICCQENCPHLLSLSKHRVILKSLFIGAPEIKSLMTRAPQKAGSSYREILIKQKPHATAS